MDNVSRSKSAVLLGLSAVIVFPVGLLTGHSELVQFWVYTSGPLLAAEYAYDRSKSISEAPLTLAEYAISATAVLAVVGFLGSFAGSGVLYFAGLTSSLVAALLVIVCRRTRTSGGPRRPTTR